MASESTKRPQDGHHPALCVGELAAEQQSSSLLPHPPPAKTAAGCCARGGHSHVPIKAGAMPKVVQEKLHKTHLVEAAGVFSLPF